MSDGEVGVLVVSIIVTIVSWGAWYIAPAFVRRVGPAPWGSVLLQVTPLAAGAMLWLVLRTASAHDVRDDPTYLSLYLLLGAAWVGVWIRLLAMTGVSKRDDVVERSNSSAALAVAGAMLGITLCLCRRQHRRWPGLVGGRVLGGSCNRRVLRGVDGARDCERRLRHRYRGS